MQSGFGVPDGKAREVLVIRRPESPPRTTTGSRAANHCSFRRSSRSSAFLRLASTACWGRLPRPPTEGGLGRLAPPPHLRLVQPLPREKPYQVLL